MLRFILAILIELGLTGFGNCSAKSETEYRATIRAANVQRINNVNAKAKLVSKTTKKPLNLLLRQYQPFMNLSEEQFQVTYLNMLGPHSGAMEVVFRQGVDQKGEAAKKARNYNDEGQIGSKASPKQDQTDSQEPQSPADKQSGSEDSQKPAKITPTSQTTKKNIAKAIPSETQTTSEDTDFVEEQTEVKTADSSEANADLDANPAIGSQVDSNASPMSKNSRRLLQQTQNKKFIEYVFPPGLKQQLTAPNVSTADRAKILFTASFPSLDPRVIIISPLKLTKIAENRLVGDQSDTTNKPAQTFFKTLVDLPSAEDERAIMTAFQPLRTNEKYLAVRWAKPIAEDTSDDSDIDWRKLGAISPVSDQASCGSSYAFAALDTITSMIKLGTNKNVILSVQEILDCTWDDGNMACYGGYPDLILNYAQNQGISELSKYPYKGKREECRKGSQSQKIKTFHTISGCSELFKTLKVSPLVVTVTADTLYWAFYGTGILDKCGPGRLNHSLQLVGVTKDAFILKSSWGPEWGQSGFVYLSRGEDTKGLCGICNVAYMVAA